MAKKRITVIFFYMIPIIVIFALGILVYTTMSLFPHYHKVLGDQTHFNATGGLDK